LDLPIRTHAAALFFESVYQVAPHCRFPVEAVGSVKQHFMERERTAKQRDADKSVDVLARYRPFMNGENDNGVRLFIRERKQKDVPLLPGSATTVESPQMRSSNAASSGSR
jgi:hypothetical protein